MASRCPHRLTRAGGRASRHRAGPGSEVEQLPEQAPATVLAGAAVVIPALGVPLLAPTPLHLLVELASVEPDAATLGTRVEQDPAAHDLYEARAVVGTAERLAADEGGTSDAAMVPS